MLPDFSPFAPDVQPAFIVKINGLELGRDEPTEVPAFHLALQEMPWGIISDGDERSRAAGPESSQEFEVISGQHQFSAFSIQGSGGNDTAGQVEAVDKFGNVGAGYSRESIMVGVVPPSAEELVFGKKV